MAVRADHGEDLAFTGDTLFAGGPGATGRSFSDFGTIIASIRETLLALPPETRVLPGHGPEFTVAAAEKNFDAWVSAGPEAGLAADLDEDDED